MNTKIRTDLAIENREFYKNAMNLNEEIPGIETIVEDSDKDLKITTVKVNTTEASSALGRPIGEYVTIESQYMNDEVAQIDEKIVNNISKTLKKLIPISDTNFSLLVVGLGNSNITPDALGPGVVNNLNITRHLVKYHPELLKDHSISISAIVPGVLGTTGIDTCEIIKGITEKTSPNAIIVVDALAAKEMHRISHTIQISNTGITPRLGSKK